MRREWIEIVNACLTSVEIPSPSMRREWIEMSDTSKVVLAKFVSLHAEGVD